MKMFCTLGRSVASSNALTANFFTPENPAQNNPQPQNHPSIITRCHHWLVTAGIILAGYCNTAHAGTVIWTNTATANWMVASGWSGGGVPGATDDVLMASPSATAISLQLTNNQTANSFTSSNTTTTTSLDILSGGALTVTSGLITNLLNGGAISISQTNPASAASILNCASVYARNVQLQSTASTSTAYWTIYNGQSVYTTVGSVTVANTDTRKGSLTLQGNLRLQQYLNLGNASAAATSDSTFILDGGRLEIRTATPGVKAISRQGTGTTTFLFNSGTIATYDATDPLIGGYNAAYPLDIALGDAGTRAIDVGANSTITISNTVRLINQTGKAGSLQKANTGTLIMQGANTYSGGTLVSGGMLKLASAAGESLSGNVTLANTNIGTAILAWGANNQIADSAIITMSDVGVSRVQLNGYSETIGGLNTPTATKNQIVEQINDATNLNSTLTLNVAAGQTYTHAGYVRNGGTAINSTIAIVKTGPGTQIFSGTSASPAQITYSGNTTISNGVLEFSGLNSVANNSTIAVYNPGAVKFSGGGSRTKAISGDGPVLKEGDNTLTLSGNNTYSGGTTISAGTLLVNNTTGSGTGTGSVLVTNGCTLGGTGTISGSVSTATVTTISPGSNSVGILTINGNLNLAGSGILAMEITNAVNADKLVIGGNLNPSGVTTISLPNPAALTNGDYPLIEVTGALGGSAANFSVASAPGKIYGIVYQSGTPNKVVLQVSDVPATMLTWTGDGAANQWDIATSLNWRDGGTPAVFNQNNQVAFDDTGLTNPVVNLNTTVSPAVITVSAAGDYTFTGSGGIAGTNSLTKTGAGQLTLATANSYTGDTTIGLGIVVANHLNALGNSRVLFGTGVGATLRLAQSLNLSSNLTMTTKNGATVDLGSAGNTLTITSAGNFTCGVAFTNAGKIVKAGAGRMTLTGDSTATGGATITGGVLRLGNGTDTGTFTSDIAVQTGATLDVLAAPGFTLASGQTLSGSGTVTGAVMVASGATIRPGAGGGDTSALVFRHALTNAGTLQIAINRTNANNSAKAVVYGALELGGTLTVTNVGDAPQANDVFTLFTVYATPTGNFAATNLPTLSAGLNWYQTLQNTTNVVLLVNQHPSAGNATYTRAAGASLLSIAIADVLTNVTNISAGQSVSLMGVGVASHGTASINGSNIEYTPGPENMDNDNFSYTIGDGRGGLATGMIYLNVAAVAAPATVGTVTETDATTYFFGQIGTTYIVQRNTNLIDGAGWKAISTNIVPASGVITNVDDFGDLNAPPYPAAAYYRLQPQ